MQFFKTPNIDFIGNRKNFYFLSLAIILAGFVSIALHRGFNPSIDFAGGTVVQFKFNNPVSSDIAKIRQIVANVGYAGAEVKTLGSAGNELQISVKQKGDEQIIAQKIRTSFAEKYTSNAFEVRRVETVGPKIGKELLRNAILAVLLACVAISIYVALRFKPAFGIGAVASLLHDVLILLGAISLFNIEMSLTIVTAILTVVGFSINDTIVIFDRIRENMGDGKDHNKFEEKTNNSINETLSRTTITSGTVLLVLIVTFIIFFKQNETIRDFCAAMIVGVVTGTYSSIFIASAIVVEWNKKWAIK